ncbi:MAG: hypothetical protein AUK35_06050 [Zetaproteobacteria bacterium CG2_30_46_52]|nr:MAG: hypothetical protein AUK35_06050 [Zetaproteobacteria bacterium CG2_30_46_52]
MITDGNWWLWSSDLHREVMRLLVLQGHNLSSTAREKIEQAILLGPPRNMYKSELEDDDWTYIVDHSIWLRLSKILAGSTQLGDAAMRKLQELSLANSEWKLAENERDEFLHWMSGTGDPDFESQKEIDLAPRKRSEIKEWLRTPIKSDDIHYEDTWRITCRERFFHAAFALCDLASERNWAVGRWKEALQVWSEEGQSIRSWRYLAPLVHKSMPDEVLQKLAHSLSWWLEVISKSIDCHEVVLLDLCQRLLNQPHEDGMSDDDPVMRAINHPIGHLTQAILNMWFKQEPKDNDRLPADIEPIFTQFFTGQNPAYLNGRVVLASRLITIFRVDRQWTETHLLPLFDWSLDPREAKAMWEGFLWSPRLYPPLQISYKKQFLETARNYDQLGKHARQFAAFITYAALDIIDGYSVTEFQEALSSLPQAGLDESAQALAQALESAGDQREEYWINRIQPFWQNIWPKSQDLTSKNIAKSLARLSIAAGDEFPSALSTVKDWLQAIEHPHFEIHTLLKSGLLKRFPNESLSLLDIIISDQPWPNQYIRDCLDCISEALPALSNDSRFLRLEEYYRSKR